MSDFFARRWNQNTASVHISTGQARVGSVRLTRTQQGTQRYAYLYHSELPNGSVTAVTRPTGVHEFEGELIERLEYKPYGEPIQRPREIGPIAGHNSRKSDNLADIGGEGVTATDRSADRRLPFYAYSGKEYDLETGYLYFGARYYDPSLGIWISADPVVDALGTKAAYTYARHNPISYLDINGEYAIEKTGDIRINKTTDTLSGAAQLAGYGNWQEAANTLGVSSSFSSSGGWQRGSPSLVGKTLPTKYETLGEGFAMHDNENMRSARDLVTVMQPLIDTADEKKMGLARVWNKSIGGNLDFKRQLSRRDIFVFEGIAMNRNQAGNFIWSYYLAKHGIGKSVDVALAEGASAVSWMKTLGKREFFFDEPWDTRARSMGRDYYNRSNSGK